MSKCKSGLRALVKQMNAKCRNQWAVLSLEAGFVSRTDSHGMGWCGCCPATITACPVVTAAEINGSGGTCCAPTGQPALLGHNPVLSCTLLAICFRRLPCKCLGSEVASWTKTSAIQAEGAGNIAKGSPSLFSQLADRIEDEWETFTHQNGIQRYSNHLKCPQIPLCG